MSIALPVGILNYFEADKERSSGAISACFTADAVVRDEGNTYRGREAICRWKTGAASKYTYTAEPFAIEEVAGRTVVTSHLTGDFPGSPVDLRYAFLLDGDRIAELEITA